MEVKKEIYNRGNVISVDSLPLLYTKGIPQYLFDKMVQHADNIAQIDALTGTTDSYSSMLQRAIRTALAMKSRGVTPEDVISVCSYNQLDSCIPILAALFLGAKFACTDVNMNLDDTVYLIKEVLPKLIFVSTDAVKLIEAATAAAGCDSQIVVFGESNDHLQFSEFLHENPEEVQFKPIEPESLKDTIGIVFSSGTGGFPKGVCLSHLSVLPIIPSESEIRIMTQTTSLLYTSFYWISAFNFLIARIGWNGVGVLVPQFDPVDFYTIVEKYKVLGAYLTPPQIYSILSVEGTNDKKLHSFQFLRTGGCSIAEEQVRQLKNKFPRVSFMNGYGLTEVTNALKFNTFASQEDLRLCLQNRKSVGRPQAGYSYKIVDVESEEPLGPLQEGELRIKSQHQMNGYYKRDSSEAWDFEGFIKTGDVAYYDENYCFYIVDRLKEIMKYNNFQLSPVKLENILMSHEAVLQAVVVGVPHPINGDHPTAVVTLKNGKKATADEIQKYVDQKVSDAYKLRGGVKIVAEIPLTPSGKYKRKHTRDLIVRGRI